MKNDELVLVSHVLCPYVQRVAIALHEKGAAFRRVDVDLSNKPGWFVAISPLGKTPLLQVASASGDGVIFESAVILEYLEETVEPALHPRTPLERAHERGWIEFASSMLNDIAGFYNAADPLAFKAKREALRAKFERVEAQLQRRAVEAVEPHEARVASSDASDDAGDVYFRGSTFGLVDAAFAPVFRYWEVFDEIADFGIFDGLARVQAWRRALAERPSVRLAAAPDYAQRLLAFLAARSHFSTNARSIT